MEERERTLHKTQPLGRPGVHARHPLASQSVEPADHICARAAPTQSRRTLNEEGEGFNGKGKCSGKAYRRTAEVGAVVGAGERDLHEVRVLEVPVPGEVVHDGHLRRARARRRRHLGARRLPPLHPRRLSRSRPASRHHHRHAWQWLTAASLSQCTYYRGGGAPVVAVSYSGNKLSPPGPRVAFKWRECDTREGAKEGLGDCTVHRH
jgi:hypothetical protein